MRRRLAQLMRVCADGEINLYQAAAGLELHSESTVVELWGRRRGVFVEELRLLGRDYGLTARPRSTLIGRLRRAWLVIKAELTLDSQPAVFRTIRRIEERAAQAYGAALHGYLPPLVRVVAERHHHEIRRHLRYLDRRR